MDLTKLHRAPSVFGNREVARQKMKFDMAYSPATEKFRLATPLLNALQMEQHGFDYFEVNGKPLLALVTDEKAHMWERRHKQESGEALGKGRDRVNRPLAEFLSTNFPDVENFALVQVEKDDATGLPIFEIKPWNGTSGVLTVAQQASAPAEVETETVTPVATPVPPVAAAPVAAAPAVEEIEDKFVEDTEEVVADPFEDDGF